MIPTIWFMHIYYISCFGFASSKCKQNREKEKNNTDPHFRFSIHRIIHICSRRSLQCFFSHSIGIILNVCSSNVLLFDIEKGCDHPSWAQFWLQIRKYSICCGNTMMFAYQSGTCTQLSFLVKRQTKSTQTNTNTTQIFRLKIQMKTEIRPTKNEMRFDESTLKLCISFYGTKKFGYFSIMHVTLLTDWLHNRC